MPKAGSGPGRACPRSRAHPDGRETGRGTGAPDRWRRRARRPGRRRGARRRRSRWPGSWVLLVGFGDRTLGGVGGRLLVRFGGTLAVRVGDRPGRAGPALLPPGHGPEQVGEPVEVDDGERRWG